MLQRQSPKQVHSGERQHTTVDAGSALSPLHEEHHGFPTPARAWYLVSVLGIAYIASFIDRTILTLQVGAIRASLHISDLQVSLLQGLAFAIFYTLLGIPIARAADRYRRVRIISWGVLVWSAMTAACGFAGGFFSMFLARVGVGVGEAALSPAAYSLISDAVPPRKLAHALSVYSMAPFVGSGVALLAGGALIALVPALDWPGGYRLEPWRVVFLCVAVPGVLVLGLLATVQEPLRRGLLGGSSQTVALPLGSLVEYIGQRRGAYGLLIGGYSIFSILWNGISTWMPTFFMRTFHWTAATVGVRFGLAVVVFGTTGILSGAAFCQRLRARGERSAGSWVGVICSLAVLPIGVLAPLMPSGPLALLVFCAFIFFAAAPYGVAAAAIQEITPNQMRAQLSALYLLGINLIGLGAGPTLVALFTDRIFHDDLALKFSMAALVAGAAPIAALLLWAGVAPYRRCMAEVRY